jgi:alpha-ketoglutarate-dependent taurine dioxygenase
MKHNNIHNKWGTTVEFDNPLDFFKTNPDEWRKLLYERNLIVFKNMNFTKADYVKFLMNFGKPWSSTDYKYSNEATELVPIKNNIFTVSPISNKISKRLGRGEMAWHSDIPNRSFKPFPIRSLWMVNNPDPNSGLTTWMNIEEGINSLPSDLKSQIPNIKIQQQSWYKENTEVDHYDFIKINPYTNRKSLRLNYFCDPEKKITDAWIKSVTVNGERKECKPVLGPYLKFFESQPDLLYTHKWGLYDIVIYDNWPFVHNRTKLEIAEDQERKFFRANVDHLNDNEWVENKSILNSL